MPCLSPIFSIFPRKPFLVIVLMLTLIVLGSYAAQYYSWSVSYKIIPLSETKVIVNLGAHSGATNVSTVFSAGSETSPATTVNIPLGKKLDVYTFIPHSVLDTLEHHFYSIRLTIYWKKSTWPGGEYNFKSVWLVLGGTHHEVKREPNIGLEGWGPVIDGIISPTINDAVGPETWYFWFVVDGIWTGAVSESTGLTSFPIWVYAVEAK